MKIQQLLQSVFPDFRVNRFDWGIPQYLCGKLFQTPETVSAHTTSLDSMSHEAVSSADIEIVDYIQLMMQALNENE